VAVDSDIYVSGFTSSFGAGGLDSFLVMYGFPTIPVGGVVLPTSPVENLLYVGAVNSIIAFLVVAMMRRKTNHVTR
jgi:hypothetical protein